LQHIILSKRDGTV
jgi:hypothetical protein